MPSVRVDGRHTLVPHEVLRVHLIVVKDHELAECAAALLAVTKNSGVLAALDRSLQCCSVRGHVLIVLDAAQDDAAEQQRAPVPLVGLGVLVRFHAALRKVQAGTQHGARRGASPTHVEVRIGNTFRALLARAMPEPVLVDAMVHRLLWMSPDALHRDMPRLDVQPILLLAECAVLCCHLLPAPSVIQVVLGVLDMDHLLHLQPGAKRVPPVPGCPEGLSAEALVGVVDHLLDALDEFVVLGRDLLHQHAAVGRGTAALQAPQHPIRGQILAEDRGYLLNERVQAFATCQFEEILQLFELLRLLERANRLAREGAALCALGVARHLHQCRGVLAALGGVHQAFAQLDERADLALELRLPAPLRRVEERLRGQRRAAALLLPANHNGHERSVQGRREICASLVLLQIAPQVEERDGILLLARVGDVHVQGRAQDVRDGAHIPGLDEVVGLCHLLDAGGGLHGLVRAYAQVAGRFVCNIRPALVAGFDDDLGNRHQRAGRRQALARLFARFLLGAVHIAQGLGSGVSEAVLLLRLCHLLQALQLGSRVRSAALLG
mmetsp:Transcript_39330/g.101750  ORF Transcript_39330/g.101750 Transcript_39330/m.101750 type:complete len:553 (-) Transcript_39330:1698-3356(-)